MFPWLTALQTNRHIEATIQAVDELSIPKNQDYVFKSEVETLNYHLQRKLQPRDIYSVWN